MTVEIISWSISTKVWYRAGTELATPGSAVRHASVARHVTDCATRPGICCGYSKEPFHGKHMSRDRRFLTMWYVWPAKPQISLHIRTVWSEPLLVAWIFCVSVNLLTEHHLEFLSLKGGCTGSSESTLVRMQLCWKSHVAAQLCFGSSKEWSHGNLWIRRYIFMLNYFSLSWPMVSTKYFLICKCYWQDKG